MNKFIYYCTSPEELNGNMNNCIILYGHLSSTKKLGWCFPKQQKKSCTAYMQKAFPHGHSATHIVEGVIRNLKGQEDLK